MQTPKFSIITVTYNASLVLERTILSVKNQTYQNIEYIIFDGMSTDGTQQLINNYSTFISKFVSEKDSGIYDAMNKAAKLATGDYLWFLNAGDEIYSENTINEIVRGIDNKLPDIIYGQTAIKDFEGNFLHMRRLKAPKKLTWKKFRWGMLVCHQSFIVNKKKYEDYNLKYRFSSDFDWSIRMMKKSKDIHNTHLNLSFYLSEGTTTKNRKASLKERFFIMANYYGYISTLFFHILFIFRLIISGKN